VSRTPDVVCVESVGACWNAELLGERVGLAQNLRPIRSRGLFERLLFVLCATGAWCLAGADGCRAQDNHADDRDDGDSGPSASQFTVRPHSIPPEARTTPSADS
jgi:hypothetical protein